MNLNSFPVILTVMVIGIGAGGLLIGLLIILFGRNEVGERINRYVDAATVTRTSSARTRGLSRVSRFRYRLNLTLSVFNSEEFQAKLNSANWQITGTEYHLIRIASTIAVFFLGWFLARSIFGGIALGAIASMIPGFLLFRSVQKRQQLFQDQLIDTLTLIKGAVAAGASFLQSLDVVVQEMASPTSDEFKRVRREVELGLPMTQALTNLANRMESDDLYLVVTAVNINIQVGGNLTTILESVTDTIRNRIYLFGEIRSLTAYVRYTSYLLTLLPFLTALLLVFLSPHYFEALLKPGLTRYILIYAGISLVMGNILLRRLGKIEV